jgi:S1-C subfamily serine protease
VALVIVSALVGFGIGAVASRGESSSPAATTTQRTQTTQAVPSPSSGSSTGSATNPLDTDAIAQAVDPAVVDITTTIRGGQAAGTGIVLTSDGLVLTNNHVIKGATSISVQIAGTGPHHEATVLGYSVSNDVALLQLNEVSGLETATMGDSSAVAVGDDVVAIGNALGRSGPHAVTSGQVDKLGQTITAGELGQDGGETLPGLIQIDALLQPGDSGGPLVDDQGRVIGINTAASVGGRRQSSSTTGFAIPINVALDVATKIQNRESSSTIHIGERAVLGVEVQSDVASADGVTVSGVQPGSPAAGAGLANGDVITSVDGTLVRSIDQLRSVVDAHHVGDRVEVTWTGPNGDIHSAEVALEAGPPA